MSSDKTVNLRLSGKNEDDLKVISAHLQDSVVLVKDIVFLKRNRSFVMIVNRFMWEDVEKGVFRDNKRIRCAIKFEGILKVKSKKINQKNKNKRLECLAIECNEIPSKNYEINRFCPHNGADLKFADIVGGCVVCPRHGWAFSLEEGGFHAQSGKSIQAKKLEQNINKSVYLTNV